MLVRAWTIVEDELEDRPYLAGAELTLAEIALGTTRSRSNDRR